MAKLFKHQKTACYMSGCKNVATYSEPSKNNKYATFCKKHKQTK